MSFELKFERRFCMAHRLISGKSEKCATPHGHNEFVRISLVSQQPQALNLQDNMITNFTDAKQLWHQFIDEHIDHKFQLNNADPLIQYFKDKEPDLLKNIVECPGDPTTELLAACLMAKLDAFLSSIDSLLICNALELEETPTNTVKLVGIKAYQPHLPQGDFWWHRADMSINDF